MESLSLKNDGPLIIMAVVMIIVILIIFMLFKHNEFMTPSKYVNITQNDLFPNNDINAFYFLLSIVSHPQSIDPKMLATIDLNTLPTNVMQLQQGFKLLNVTIPSDNIYQIIVIKDSGGGWYFVVNRDNLKAVNELLNDKQFLALNNIKDIWTNKDKLIYYYNKLGTGSNPAIINGVPCVKNPSISSGALLLANIINPYLRFEKNSNLINTCDMDKLKVSCNKILQKILKRGKDNTIQNIDITSSVDDTNTLTSIFLSSDGSGLVSALNGGLMKLFIKVTYTNGLVYNITITLIIKNNRAMVITSIN